MKKPTRKQAMAWIKYHAIRGDIGAAQRIYIENRISWAAYRAALSEAKEVYEKASALWLKQTMAVTRESEIYRDLIEKRDAYVALIDSANAEASEPRP